MGVFDKNAGVTRARKQLHRRLPAAGLTWKYQKMEAPDVSTSSRTQDV